MKRIIRYHRWGWVAFAVLLLLVSACSKAIDARDYEADPHGVQYGYPGGSSRNNDWAIGTVRSQDGMRYIRLDAQTVCLVVNPDEVKDIPDRTRVFLQYRCVVIPSLPDFCTDAILVEWASPLELGEIRSDLKDGEGDPVGVVLDWMTCLEDGFLTLHYSFPTQGTASHGFYLAPGPGENEYRFVHDAHEDTEGDLTEGIICFDVESLLPDTGGNTVTLSLTYLNLDKTSKTLTVDYRSPQ